MVTMNGEEVVVGLPVVTPMLDHHSILDDDDDGMSDDSESQFTDGHDLMTATMEDEVTAQLAAAGPVGMAAAAAIASAKKRKRPHQFETNPSIRKRQQTRLLRKLRQTIDEFTIRVGMQAVVTVAIPGKPQNSFKCFGAKPLEDVIRNLRPTIMAELESALAQHAPPPVPEDPTLHELPPLVIDGIPTPVEKMTQAQLRAFIPLMLKYSTGRGKPGWGKESTRPPWWPQDLPWANVRMDARTEDEKQKVSWTHALRQIVINCYKYHGREDLLPVFSGDHEDSDMKPQISKMGKASSHITISSSTNSANNTHSVLSVSPQAQSQSITSQTISSEKMYQICEFLKPGNQDKYEVLVGGSQVGQYGPTVLQTISNPDGTVSIIQMDPTNSIITLPDGTTAQVQGVATLQHNDGQSIGDMSGHHEGVDGMPVTVDLNSMAHASLGQEGQIILTGEDGHAYPVTVSGMITVPVNHNMYQTVMANISSIQSQNADGTLQYHIVQNKKGQRVIRSIPRNLKTYSNSQTHTVLSEDLSNVISIESHEESKYSFPQVVTPMVLPKIEPGTEGETTSIPVSALTGDPTQTQIVTVNANGQVIHNDKIYQICEFLKPGSEGGQEKVIMMTQVGGPTQSDEGEETECIIGNGHMDNMETTITMETEDEAQQIEQEDSEEITQEVTEEELAEQEQETQEMEQEDGQTET